MRHLFWGRRRLVHRAVVATAAAGLVTGLLTGSGQAADAAAVTTSTTSYVASNGVTYTATNHLTPAASGPGREWLLAWSGPDDPAAPDFMAVIDATRGSAHYGEIVNTVTMGPGTGNEPHHMQYVWHKGDQIYASGIKSDTTFVFDSHALPALKLIGVNDPQDTACGTMPDAYTVLKDGTAYGTFVGGPNVTGPCTYTNGQVRDGNGAAGSPGEVVHFDKTGKTLAEIPVALAQGEDPNQCANIPAIPKATCANPHGVAVREDLGIMVASDFTETRSIPKPGTPLPDGVEKLARQTVRVFDIKDENNPKLRSISKVSDGPRVSQEWNKAFGESRVVMETALPNKRNHRGAFVSTMAGGAIFYTPDIMAEHPKWREIFDDTTAYRTFHPDGSVTGGGDNGSWLMMSPDDRYLFHTVMGSSTTYGKPLDVTTGMVYVLDVHKLLADGDKAACSIDRLDEAYRGGDEPDCPALTGVMPINDPTDGGPHWGTMDTFRQNAMGQYRDTDTVSRIATSNYFIAGSFGGGGDHRICMFNLDRRGRLSLDTTFRDENTGQACVNMNRQNWPHGSYGNGRAHGLLFVVSDKALR
ncbi:hypothetical protein [Streptomyces sp. NPDC048282]|uniref:hypothetical protein n=1 Tax=Streptomyces sp. NPDC048282 TaxID=3365528 RepID=UPI00371A22FB